MKGEWCYFEKHFSTDKCKQILEAGLQIPDKYAEIGVSGTGKNAEHRRSKVRFIQKSDQNFGWLFDEMWKMALWANRDWFGFHLSELSYIQMAEYKDTYGGEYKKHQDVFWINQQDNHRKLSAIVQLTDPSEYEGGDFKIYDVNHTLPVDNIRQQGTVIFIPSFLYHAALPVTKGTRYSLACWFEGPKWR